MASLPASLFTVFALSMCVSRLAGAQDLGELVEDPRNLGRAQTSLVSSDSGAALLYNPGGMVRRSVPRLVTGLALSDEDRAFQSAEERTPLIESRARPVLAPLLAYHWGPQDGTWVLGVLAMQGRSEVLLPEASFGQPADDVARLFPHRYGGTRFVATHRRLAIGGAMRVGDWLGIGASVGMLQLSLIERNRMWAGFDGRDPLLTADRDLLSELEAHDSFIPTASVGALIAPPSLPLELALSAEGRSRAQLRGDARVEATHPSSPNVEGTPSIALDLPAQLVARTGIRYLGRRFFVELGAAVVVTENQSRHLWRVASLELIDESGARVVLSELPALVQTHVQSSAGVSFDIELESGFLWLTGGYRWNSAASSRAAYSPAFARPATHTFAAGLEGSHENFTLTLGYARSVSAREDSTGAREVFNPFAAGTGPSNLGDYATSADRVGACLEIVWE